jgi:hypothetical protein
MDHLSMMARSLALAVLLATASACNQRQSVFANLGMIVGGRDFPHTTDALADCQKAGDEACLKTFGIVKEAKAALFSHSPQQALAMTLQALKENCQSAAAEFQVDMSCMGAISALNFFSSPGEDQAIRGLLSELPVPILEKILLSEGSWLARRQDKAPWHQWAASVPLPDEAKQIFLARLESDPKQHSTITQLIQMK